MTVYLVGARAVPPPLDRAYLPAQAMEAWHTALELRRHYGFEFLAASFLIAFPDGYRRWWVTRERDLDGGQPYPPRMGHAD